MVATVPQPAFAGLDIQLCAASSAARPQLEAFIRATYASVHAADITVSAPFLLAVSHAGLPSAAVGLTPATPAPLFLEQYLPRPIEAMLEQGGIAAKAERARLIEIGSLAVSNRAQTPLLFTLLAHACQLAGFEWLVFTAIPRVTLLLQQLNCSPVTLAEAKADALPTASHEAWGRYYQHRPHVMALNLTEAIACGRANPMVANLLDSFADFAGHIATQLLATHNNGISSKGITA